MRKLVFFLFLACCVSQLVNAQLNEDGGCYYRLKNVTTGKYAVLVDDQLSYNQVVTYAGGGTALLMNSNNARTKAFDKVGMYLGTDLSLTTEDCSTNPGSVLYIKPKSEGSSSYDLQGQAVGLYYMSTGVWNSSRGDIDFSGIYTTISQSGSDANSTPYYTAKVTLSVKYIVTISLGNRYFVEDTNGKMNITEATTNGNWYLEPLTKANLDKYYFSAAPQSAITQNGKYYTTLRTSFPFTVPEGSHIVVYKVSALPEANGVATLVKLNNSTSDVIPAGTPVVIENDALDAASNKLLPVEGTAPSTMTADFTTITVPSDGTNSTALYSNYGCHKHDDYGNNSSQPSGYAAQGDAVGFLTSSNKYTGSTLYKLSVNSEGRVGFWTVVTSSEYLNGNEAYSTVPCALFAETPATETTLAKMSTAGEVGEKYKVTGTKLQAVGSFSYDGNNYLVVKDEDVAAHEYAINGDAASVYEISNAKTYYDQNNWMLVNIGEDAAAQYMSNYLTVTGTITDADNTTMTKSTITLGDAISSDSRYTLNWYTAANFLSTTEKPYQNCSGTEAQEHGEYFFMTPKRCELAEIAYAVYDASSGNFYVGTPGDGVNAHGFKGGFKVDWSYNGSTPTLTTGSTCNFTGLVKVSNSPISAPKKAAAVTPYTASGTSDYIVFPIGFTASNVVTSVNDMNTAKQAVSVRYYNLMGVESTTPFDGVNVVVTRYTDGSMNSQKLVK